MKETTGTFAELYYLLAKDGDEAEVIIGDVDMPATLVADESIKFTPTAYSVFGEVLNAPATLTPSEEMYPYNLIEVDCDNYELGENLILALSGYISESQYIELFQEEK